MSASSSEALRRMSKLVNSLMSRADSGPFLEPVDWRGLELYDYPKIIKKMMDLGTVKRKLERKQYRTAHECAQDIRLVWKNCLTYNMEGSDFWLLAKSFSKKFEDRYKKIKAEFDVGADLAERNEADNKKASASSEKRPSTPNLDTKMQFASNIFLLSGMELGHVMRQLEVKCPQALEDLGGERVEINVNALDNKLLVELDRYVREKVGSRHAHVSGASEDHASLTRPHKKKKK